MSASYLALADLLKVNNKNLADIEVSDLLQDAPLMRALAAITASKGMTAHEYLKETTAPTVGFRSVNDGRYNSKSEDTLVQISCAILDASFSVDKALADAYMKGGAEAYIDREAKRHLAAAMFHAEEQLIYGSSNDSLGFNGLANTLDNSDDSMVVDAEGSTDGSMTSVWLIRTGESDVALVAGNDGNIRIDESTTIEKTGDNGTYPAYYTPIDGWLGLQAGSAYSFGRICNLDDSDNTLSDALLHKALEKFPSSRMPNLIVMNRRSSRQLRDSRTSYSPTGAPAARPLDVDGIPVILTDAIVNTEDTVTASGS